VRSLALLIFLVAVYPVAPVIGFAWIPLELALGSAGRSRASPHPEPWGCITMLQA
jgi:hypothetical protein